MNNPREAKPATAADVARAAGVSQATVSYVLNNVSGQSISPQTTAAVLQAVKRLGYRPNLVARNLRVGGSGLVLYVVPRMALGEVLMEVGSRLTAALAQRGIVLSLQIETNDPHDVIAAIHNLRPVAVASVFPLSGTVLDAVAAAGLPQIYLGSGTLQALGELNDVVGELWVQHLTARGHRQLAFAYSDDETMRPQGDYWLAGLRRTAAEHALPEVLSATAARVDEDSAAVARWHTAGVTAVCAQTEPTAIVVMRALRRLGLRCPDDVAVTAADAGAFGELSDPPLTSVAFDADAIASASVTAFLTELGFPPDEAAPTRAFASLVVRRST
ncbi:LacI family DNA-binding transcriptional regulator [Mycobacterium sp. CVI_P3]|uniref:LacI family DNA-binding transcriptional regulator n=1 Tax=Mycobacterium pinniadriaticum TaxID=2994102 RepID=A0ABT3S8I2_9MYCO|nr:LacI family DNA-binding transcriptional regulator [Mycobacterium pinniadriaticum]MCX2929384.1 LacI family DNA-binding transcriptional regulator [Mycobacterium pinniadriaticum]MCX2935808.1 LacI family DNA-binding transcriptional regulator [Mycobacterium pinniadriaticum]